MSLSMCDSLVDFPQTFLNYLVARESRKTNDQIAMTLKKDKILCKIKLRIGGAFF